MRDIFYIRETPSAKGNLVTICGMTFPEFVNGIERPLNLLLLRSNIPDTITFHEINFNGIQDNLEDCRFNDLEELIRRRDYINGDFSWIDYRNERELVEIQDVELAELCFLAQQGRPLNSPFLQSPGNRFVYFSHDDGFHTLLYVRDRLDLLSLLSKTIRHKAACLDFKVTGIDDFPSHFQNGIIIDFKAISKFGLPIWAFEEPFSFDTFNRSDLNSSTIVVTLAAERITNDTSA